MKRLFVHFSAIALAAAAFLVIPSAGMAITYSGSLTSTGTSPGILGSGVWVNPGVTTLDWLVEDVGNGLWRYSYTLTVPRGNISHFLLEVSPTFKLTDIVNSNWNPNELEVKTWSPGPGNPNLPESFYGLKFDSATGLTSTFELYTYRVPVWGDFYSKNGTAGNPKGVFNTAYNAAFDSAPPTMLASDGTVANKILVPDTRTTPGNVIPEANTLALAAFGLSSLVGVRSRFARRR